MGESKCPRLLQRTGVNCGIIFGPSCAFEAEARVSRLASDISGSAT